VRGDFDAHHSRAANAPGRRVDRSGVGVIGAFIPVVRKVPIGGRRRDVLLFHQLPAMHDDVGIGGYCHRSPYSPRCESHELGTPPLMRPGSGDHDITLALALAYIIDGALRTFNFVAEVT
jgi:hypothetical protein